MRLFFIAIFILLTQQKAIALDQDTRPYELKQADKKLNDVYQNILGKLPAAEQIKLKKAQRAWVAFRDLDCAWAFGAEPLDCMIERTDSRTKQLEETMFFDANGNYLHLEEAKKK